MHTVQELYQAVRGRFPEIAEKVDREHVRKFGELEPDLPYSWFESLADALNADMRREVDCEVHKSLFLYIERVLVERMGAGSSDEIYRCIDVAFVENLFWQVSSARCAPYWQLLPNALKALYLAFHRNEP
jgi:hypothetical protein